MMIVPIIKKLENKLGKWEAEDGRRKNEDTGISWSEKSIEDGD